MSATPIDRPAPGESLIGIDPELLRQLPENAVWRRRMNLFTGRTLSPAALTGEQSYRAGLLATLGRSVTAGVENGLVVAIDGAPDPLVSVTPGYGITAAGEDLTLLRALQTRLGTLPVIDLATGLPFEDASGAALGLATYLTEPAATPAGVLVLQPIVAQVDEFDDGTNATVVSGNSTASCDVDPAAYAYEDWQIADGVRLAFVPWPAGLATLPLPTAMPAATYRNRLACAVFTAEAELLFDDVLPWSAAGVPVGLVALGGGGDAWKAGAAFALGATIVDANGSVQTVTTAGTSGATPPPLWSAARGAGTQDATVVWTNAGVALQPRFVDRSAVVRQGGRPRQRSVVPLDPALGAVVQPALAEARMAQLSEQIGAQLAGLPAAGALASFASSLPPSGVVPAAAIDFVAKRAPWFPAAWSIAAAPVRFEELEAALESGIGAASLDPGAAESIEVLVPLPDGEYDPAILGTARVDPDFQAEIDLATARRDAILCVRKTVQAEFNALQGVIGPNVPANPNLVDTTAGLTADEVVARDRMPAFWPRPLADTAADRTFGTLSPVTWQTGATYALGQVVIDPNGSLEIVTTAGKSTAVTWPATAGGTTTEAAVAVQAPATPVAPVAWLNAGVQRWFPHRAYALGQIVFDPFGNVQRVTQAGFSGASETIWKQPAPPENAISTPDGSVVWKSMGVPGYGPITQYLLGMAIVDPNGNVQIVTNGGVSASTAPSWGDAVGEMTDDGPVQWRNVGKPTVWARDSAYDVGQYIVDTNNVVQTVAQAGVSGRTQYAWNPVPGLTTVDGTVTWTNAAPGTWTPGYAYRVGDFLVDPAGNLQTAAVVTGNASLVPPVWNAVAGGRTQDGGVSWVAAVYASAALANLRVVASAAPYTIVWDAWSPAKSYALGSIVTDKNGNQQVVTTAGTSAALPGPPFVQTVGQTTQDGTVIWTVLALKRPSIPLIGDDDWSDLQTFGLGHFIDRLNAKIARANDLIDMAFLTAQTDIYRFRQNVLGSVDASRLATSPVLANIATGVTAASTAQDLKDYFASSIGAPGGLRSATGTPIASRFETIGETAARLPLGFANGPALFAGGRVPIADVHTIEAGASMPVREATGTVFHPIDEPGSSSFLDQPARPASGVRAGSAVEAPAASPAASPTANVQAQSPIVGAQLDIRTLSIAERLSQPKSQESLFYAVGNRFGLMQLLVDLELAIDDLPFFVDGDPPPAAVVPPVPAGTPAAPAVLANSSVPTDRHTIFEIRSAAASPAVFKKLQNPYVRTDADESGIFSVGVRVVEQHTKLLRALESRVQSYSDFARLCTTALASIESDAGRALVVLRGLETELADQRQNIAFTSSLLVDEAARVGALNARRAATLRSVAVVAYARPRTILTEADVPSRQLAPGNVANPAPACIQQHGAVPPEISEIVALLKEAPLAWLPAIAQLLTRLPRPVLLQGLARSTVARAALQLGLPDAVSSATLASSIYGSTIAAIYQSNQQMLRDVQVQRAAFAPSLLTQYSWANQVAVLANLTTIADLGAAQAVEASVASAVARLQSDVSAVAGCIYVRANGVLPADRLAWAEYLRGAGSTTSLRNLSVLPRWNEQSFADRQALQQLADWLFAQIDGESGAVAYMSDVVRVCILVASHAPVSDVIGGAVVVRARPVVGITITLNLPNPRVGSGMYVQFFSKGRIAAEGVVSDLDQTSVSATVTAVHLPGVYLEVSDVAHFTTQRPYAAALRNLT